MQQWRPRLAVPVPRQYAVKPCWNKSKSTCKPPAPLLGFLPEPTASRSSSTAQGGCNCPKRRSSASHSPDAPKCASLTITWNSGRWRTSLTEFHVIVSDAHFGASGEWDALDRLFGQLQPPCAVDEDRLAVGSGRKPNNGAGGLHVLFDLFQHGFTAYCLGTGAAITDGDGTVNRGRHCCIVGHSNDG